jgi:hypothetical protein
MTWLTVTENLGSVASKLAVTFYQGNHDRNHKLRNIVYTETYESTAGMLLYINGKFISFGVFMSGNEEKQESLHEEWQTIQCAK